MLRFSLWAVALAMASGLGLGSGPAGAQGKLEIIAEFPAETPPGNIAVTPDGRLIMSLHQFYGPKYKVVEILPGGDVAPFPSEAWNQPPDASGIGLNGVLGLRSDPRGIVWMLDTAAPGKAGRLVAWDTLGDRLHRVIYLPPPLVPENSFLNDLAVDLVHEAIYIADIAGGDNAALIVVDLKTGRAMRRLEGHKTTKPEDVPMVIDGQTVKLGDAEARIGVDPITIDPAGQWVYFAPMSATTLYRARTRDLIDFSLSDEELAERVERYGKKPISDGITMDGAGNVYITDITGNAVGVTTADGSYRVLYKDKKLLSWPDGMAFGPDGAIYVTVNQLHRSPPLNGGENKSTPPYYVVRFPALAPGAVGR